MTLYDKEAEQAVLGSILFDNSVIEEVMERLKPVDFFFREHKLIFEYMIELFQEGSPIDEVLIGSKIGTDNEANTLLWSLVDCSPEVCNVGEYITIVLDRSISRQLQTLADETKIAANTKNVNEVIAEVLAKVTKLKDSIKKTVEFSHIGDILKDVFEELRSASDTPEKVVGYETRYVDMNALTQGLHPKEIFVIAARPSMGKTALAMNIATDIAQKYNDKDVLIFSVETHNNQLGTRIISSGSKVDSTKMRSGNLDQDEWDRLSENSQMLSEMPLYINDSVSTIEQVVYLSHKHRKTNKISLIVVDFLQLLKTANKKFSREQEVSEVSRSLKLLAKDLDCCVMPLCQLNRDLEKRPDKRPVLSDLRESGAIEQDADVIAFIYREEKYNENTKKKGIAEIYFAKHKNGETKTIELQFTGKYTRFDNLYGGYQHGF